MRATSEISNGAWWSLCNQSFVKARERERERDREYQTKSKFGKKIIIQCPWTLNYFFLKPGFHYPSWRPELTARVDGWPVSITRQHGPWKPGLNFDFVLGTAVTVGAESRLFDVTASLNLWNRLVGVHREGKWHKGDQHFKHFSTSGKASRLTSAP